MNRHTGMLGGTLAGVLAVLLITASSALAAFGFSNYDFTIENENGTPVSKAGSHPFSIETSMDFNATIDPELGEITEDQARDFVLRLPEGFAGDPNAVPRCSNADFLALPGGNEETLRYTTCPNSTAVGLAHLRIGYKSQGTFFSAVYNLEPPNGAVQRLGLVALGGVPVTIDVRVSEEAPYNVYATVTNISQVTRFYGSDLTLWGNPASSAHDSERGECVAPLGAPVESGNISRGECPVSLEEKPLLTMPRSCGAAPLTIFEARSWQSPETWVQEVSELHDDSTPIPQPLELSGCSELDFAPTISADPTSSSTQGPTGLDFGLDIEDEGLTDVDEIAGSDVKRAEVTLPEGFTTNPSIAEGLVSCTKEQLALETAAAAPGEGCPQASKIGSLEVETPVLEDPLGGSLYVAKPFDNEAGNSLLALYMVIKSAKFGISVKQPLQVKPDPVTGQLTTIAEDLPQLPFSHFNLHFREGPRSPLTTPPGCGSYNADAVLTPWSGGPDVQTSSTFEITTGPAGGACPPGGVGPFAPSFEAGSTNPVAGSYSPFVLKLSRENGSQQLKSIDTTLPLGLIGKLAGVAECSDAQIAAASARSAPLEGVTELESPSCPMSSEVGAVRVGAGSGTPAYVTGRAYLAGPYKGAPLSLVVITPAISGPFDLGTVVVRAALYVDETTAQIRAVSDPFPTILAGIPLEVRSVSINMSRPQFVLNPTSCEPTSVVGAATSVLNTVASLSYPFQVDACAALGFGPKLALRLKGGTKRSQHPALRTTLTYPQGYASSNIARATVTLPATSIIDNAHINNPCTRVQFNENACPPSSVLGTARAFSPLLDQPLEGPVYFRSNGGVRLLPDIVADLKGKIHVVLVGGVDALKVNAEKSRIRTTFAIVPDAPVSKFTLSLYGGKKGLLVNTANLCGRASNKALVKFVAHNGRKVQAEPAVANDCKKRLSKRHR